jgi:hypothetical protein
MSFQVYFWAEFGPKKGAISHRSLELPSAAVDGKVFELLETSDDEMGDFG